MYALIGKNGLLGKEIEKELREKRLPYQSFEKKELDITNRTSIERNLKDASVIINCAAYTNVPLAEKNRDLAFSTNVLGPKHLTDYLKKRGNNTVLLHFSTDYVFDGKKKAPYTESSQTNPLNVYGQTKLEGEKYVLSYPNGLVIRTSWLFSADETCFVGKILRAVQEKEIVSVVDDQVGRPTFAKDLARASLALKNARGLLHYANRGTVSWYGFAKEIVRIQEELAQKKCKAKLIPISSGAQFLQRPAYSALCTDSYETRYGKIPHWQPALSTILSEGAYARQ